jgi:mono/diheme cytochrome c family protein
MKKIYVILLSIVAVILVIVLCTGAYLKFYLPNIAKASEISIEKTEERIERGRYLAHHVAVCMDCHSARDWSQYAGPIAGNLGGGGEKFGKEMGFPGNIYAANITPSHIGNWTDGEVFRAITTGVNKDGKALFPIMPYQHYGLMDQEDVYSIIAYIRTLDPLQTTTPERELDFPVNFLINTMPGEARLTTKPDEKDVLAYGQYLTNSASCIDCHSKTEKGAIVAGSEFGGGMEFKQPAGIVRSPNITPHPESGIGQWSKETFVKRFKQYADSSYQSPRLTMQDLNTPMPWQMYAGMKEADLEAIYTYLKSLTPIDNTVNRFEKNK